MGTAMVCVNSWFVVEESGVALSPVLARWYFFIARWVQQFQCSSTSIGDICRLSPSNFAYISASAFYLVYFFGARRKFTEKYASSASIELTHSKYDMVSLGPPGRGDAKVKLSTSVVNAFLLVCWLYIDIYF